MVTIVWAALAGAIVIVGLERGWEVSRKNATAAEVIAAEDAVPQVAAEVEPPDTEEESGISLPTDRLKQRQFDRASRLIEDRRWSDAATLLDEILGTDRDFFFRPNSQQRTWKSMKADASRLVGLLPQPGREAYELQFRARADRFLQQAIAAGDAAGVVAVARRWFHTPAGQFATLIAAIDAIESNQPLAAAAWLDRLSSVAVPAEPFEPTLSLMRAIAWWRAGDRLTAVSILEKARTGRVGTVRIGGKDLTSSFSSGGAAAWLATVAGEPPAALDRKSSEWWLNRGDASRNGISNASRPLLVPRYRVPLTRHPQEATLLEKRRKDFADRDTPLLPAGVPLVVDGFILVHTPMGLLAIDFKTGKRIWLQTGSAAASFADGFAEGGNASSDGADANQPSSLQSVFDDATSGTMSSDGRLVFAVESDPAAMNPPEVSAPNGMLFQGMPNKASDWKRGNVLSAYDVAAKGALRWRLPLVEKNQAEKKQDEPKVSQSWYMGAPLPIGDQLFVLVEERKEIRLDVLESTAGRLVWSQPLAELDEDRSIDNSESRPRRVAGLSPSFADGVLVCPTGEGVAVAVDLATRTLLWAYNYPLSQPRNRLNGIGLGNVRFQGQGRLIINGQLVNASGPSALGWRDSAAILSGGCVVLTPQESDELYCLDLRTGEQKWKIPRKDRLSVAGVHNGHVILVGRRSVESLALANAQAGWELPLALEDASPSGRGILTASRLFLPLDTPEVIEIDLSNGSIVGRSAARGGAVPGNLLAYRGEVVSQGVDSLDVFHQAVPLESQIDTALKQRFEKDQRKDSWATLWQGQLDLDRGAIARGLQRVREAHAAEPARIPAEVVAEAILFGMQRDFAAAVPAWRESLELREALPIAGLPTAKSMLRVAVDGFLRLDNLPEAWQACRQLLSTPSEVPLGDMPLVEDSSDARLSVGELRWMQGRLSDIIARATPPLREEINAFGASEVASTKAIVDPAVRLVRLGRLFEQLKRHASGKMAGQMLVDDLGQLIAASPPSSEATRDMAVRREFLLMQFHDNNQSGSETAAEVRVGNANAPDRMPVSAAAGGAATNDLGAAWPVGRVEVSNAKPEEGRRRVTPIPLDLESGSFVPGLRLGIESQPASLVATDGFGRRVGEPFALDTNGKNGGVFAMFHPMGVEAAAVGRVVVVRSGSLVAAYELASRNGEKTRQLWTSFETSNVRAAVPMGFGRMPRQRIQRNGNVPLGMRISEPDDINASTLVQGVRALATGVPVYLNRSIQLHDPATGDLLWARHRLPALGELIGDDDFLCLCPLDGKAAIVLSMADGRIVRRCEMPRREQRLTTCGRSVVTIEPVAARTGGPQDASGEQDYSRRIRLAIFDPVSLNRIELGEYAGEARATPVGVDRLAIVEPGGSLTLLNLRAGSITFQVQLPDMPSGCERLHVMPWQDRLLVIVGRQETQAEQEQLKKFGIAVALPQMMSPNGSESHGLLTASIWAVAHDTGDMLWPVPATIVRHFLYRNQPSELPLLLFARQLLRNGREPSMSVLCLDKRTGHAVYLDDEISTQSHTIFSCEMSGNPQKHSIVLACTGSEKVSDVELRFTGEPMSPRPPFQASFKPPPSGDLATEIQLWFEKIWPFPFRFPK